MSETDFAAAIAAPPPDASLMHLMRRFNYAFRRTRDIHLAMSAVNEVLEEPVTYSQFLEIAKA